MPISSFYVLYIGNFYVFFSTYRPQAGWTTIGGVVGCMYNNRLPPDRVCTVFQFRQNQVQVIVLRCKPGFQVTGYRIMERFPGVSVRLQTLPQDTAFADRRRRL